jgi:class 3 adenylate cyclase
LAEDLRRRVGEVGYALSADAHVAYRVVGSVSGTHDVVLVMSGTMPMDAMFDDPVAARLVEGLADLGRFVMFDRCGIGLSDPPPDSDTSGLARWREDLESVITATGVVQPVVVTSGPGAGVAIVYCDRHPAEVSSLVLVEPGHRARVDHDIVRRQIAGEVDSVALWCPSRADEPGFREWFHRAGQRGASPGLARRAYPGTSDADVRTIEEAASRLLIPALVLRRPAHPWSPPRSDDPVVAMIPGAVRVDLPGEDLLIYGGEVDALVAEIARFVTGEHRLPAPERVLAALLYSDLVASTDRATTVGDAHWKRVLDRHDEIARSCIGRRGGAVIKTTGDGILATLPSATTALRSARELRAALHAEELEVRVAIHVGDIDRRDDDISGINVVIAARVLNLAGPGEILMTSAALTATGESLKLEPRGEHHLKGVRGTWPIFSILDT